MVIFEMDAKYQGNSIHDKHQLSQEEELKKNDSIRDALERSSLHGVSQIIGKQLFISRRIIWSVIFIASGCIFMVQFVLSAERYLSKPVSVDVKINYNESIIFPAVTICNSNAFRLSSAYEKGYYNIITDMFGPDEDVINLEKTFDLNNITVEELYLETGQLKEDFITSCRWEGSPCKMEDFVMILTDFGLCFSFNTGENGAELYKAYTTGSGGGLSLQVNIEQYEYMQGPNEGAGLKVLIHDNAKTTLVKDNALAIRPGTHSFIASKITQVNYLKPDYGICNDSVSLDFFTKFTMENCFSNCMEKFFISRCGCRDFYMPSINGLPSSCSLAESQFCLSAATANFSSVRKYCDCPIPCRLLMHEPVLSFAAKSNFDIARLLQDEKMVQNLKHKYITAREISEKVDNTKIEKDKQIIKSYTSDLNQFQNAIYVMNDKLNKVVLENEKVNKDIVKRLDFHIRRMLTDLKQNVQENFIYNFDTNTRRSFDSLTSDLDGFFQLFTEQLNGTSWGGTTDKRWLAVLPMHGKLSEKKELIATSLRDIRQVNNAYRSAKQKTNKLISHKRHYDKAMSHKSFISLFSQGKLLYNKLKITLDKMENAVDMCLDEVDIYIHNGTTDVKRIKKAQSQFERQQTNVNQDLFRYQYNVVQQPLKVLEKLEFRLYGYNTTISGNHETFLRQVKKIQNIIGVSINSKLSDLISLSHISSTYMSNKTWLAEQVTIDKIKKHFMQLNMDMVDMVAVVKNIQREFRSQVLVYEHVWKIIIESPFTQTYYKQIYEDAQLFPTLNSSSREFNYYSNVLLYTVEHLYDFNTTWNSTLNGNITVELFLELLVNTDIHSLEIKDVLFEVKELFRNFSLEFDYMYEISNILEELTNSYNSFYNQMKQFLDGNVIDEDFFLENFMRIDIYMQELRYEEITQQKAYDAIKLFSDIGGSMGLFIGGSVLSLAEFVDIFIYRWMLKSCRDKKIK